MNNFVVKPRPEDYVLGSSSPILFKAVNPSGIWTSRLEFFENQKFSFETNGCVLFAAQESFDAQMDFLITNGTIPSDIVAQFHSMGYMDLGIDGQAHFHSSPRFLQILTGNGFNGNSAPEAWDAIRANGVLPWSDLPLDATITQSEYLTGITPQMKVKATQFLALIGGKQSVQYHWVQNGYPEKMPAMITALQQAPLCIGVATNDGWNQTIPTDPILTQPPNHSVMTYAISANQSSILDHYLPYEKVLDKTYPIPFVLQGIVSPIFAPSPTPIPPAPTLPSNPTIPQVSNWLTRLIAWLQTIQGRTLTSNQMDSFNFSFIKSGVFWSSVVTVLSVIFTALNAQYPSVSWIGVVVSVLSLISTNYLHKASVLAAAQSSVTLGRVVSGQ